MQGEATPFISRDVPIYSTGGNYLAANVGDLFDGTLANPVEHDEYGQSVTESRIVGLRTGIR